MFFYLYYILKQIDHSSINMKSEWTQDKSIRNILPQLKQERSFYKKQTIDCNTYIFMLSDINSSKIQYTINKYMKRESGPRDKQSNFSFLGYSRTPSYETQIHNGIFGNGDKRTRKRSPGLNMLCVSGPYLNANAKKIVSLWRSKRGMVSRLRFGLFIGLFCGRKLYSFVPKCISILRKDIIVQVRLMYGFDKHSLTDKEIKDCILLPNVFGLKYI
jgi:hypothetical protein